MMDPANSYLGKMLLEEITPVVMVLRTQTVEESCLKNGFSLVQMLSPFCLFNNIDVPVRTVSDQPYRLQKFKFRLYYASDIRQPNKEAVNDHLKQVVINANEKDATDLCSDPPQLGNVLTVAKTESLPSWFQAFNKELILASAFSEHEAFDHPVACLVVVSSKDEQPVNKFVDLFNTNQLPSLLNDGAMDPKILKHYLLVHDNQDGSSEKAINLLTEMKSAFGTNDCSLLCINSGQDGSGDQQDSPWFPYETGSPLALNSEDVNEMKELMQDLSSKHIIPHMEQKIRLLNQQVSATRKGFRNQIKNLWWRKGKEDTPDAPSGGMYTFSSIESQIRVLGDYAFMLRDYELALSNYRLLSTDYKLDKAWKRFAGVQEMQALTYFMLDQSRKDAGYCMESAFNTYLKLGSSGQRNATRCGLWWTEMLKCRDMYKEAAGVYFWISNEEPSLHAAVMLEQASYCYLMSNPPMLRKYGFHLVLAGNRYNISDQRKHAIRTYRGALSVYKVDTWKYINDHVHFHIGKWYAFLELFDVAIKHMLEILACSHQSIVTQELFLRDFLQIVQKMGKTFEVFKLQLPAINLPSLKVIFEDHRTFASPTAVNVKESLWRSLEEDMVPSIPTMRFNWLESQPKYSKKHKDSNICVAGEAITVEIEFRNPLQIPISISGLSLICQSEEETTIAGDESVSGTGLYLASASQDELELQKLRGSWEKNAGSSSFILSEVDFSLGGRETTLVQLTITPRVEGILNIVGVRWKFSDSVIGYHNFDSAQIKKKSVKGRKAKPSSSNNLKFTVIKALPKLEACIQHIPKRTYAGELHRLVLELRNTSEFPVKNLKMKINRPRCLIPGYPEDMNAEYPACLQKQKNSGSRELQDYSVEGSDGLVFQFPEDVTVGGEQTLSWPLWLQLGDPGSISLFISIYYEMEDISSGMNFRTLRMHYDLEALPSLDVSVKISPCPSRLQEFLVRMDIVNRTSSATYHLQQLSSIGQQWKILPLSSDGPICPSQALVANQALSCFFKLENCSKSTNDKTLSTHSSIGGSDVRLGVDGSEAMFDMSGTPIAAFHHHDRLHQEESNQGNPSIANFILISQLQESITGPSNSSRLFSHHVYSRSIASTSPVWWLMDGPRALNHDFSISFCEIELFLTIHNSSDSGASVRINTGDSSTGGHLSDTVVAPQSPASFGLQVGWHNIALTNDSKDSPNNTIGTQFTKSSSDGGAPFIWSASSSNLLELGPFSTVKVPLRICLFSPGTYDLSSYTINWSLQVSGDERISGEKTSRSSGTSQGNPYYLTVLQFPQ
ncbi:hypothetical protein MKX01_002982 [Papaver californicum]|nr:hypothetical protein MKX01_002982 [Papaver californicum]